MARQLFDTTLYGEDKDVAVAVVSVPTEYLPDPALASSPGNVLAALQLRAVAEVPPSHFADALAAILATTNAEDAAVWLAEPPDPVSIAVGEDLESFGVAWSYQVDEDLLPRAPELPPPEEIYARDLSEHYARPPKTGEWVPKDHPRAEDLREFARDAATEAYVPFQRSPVDLFGITDLLQVADATRVLITTVRTNPLLLAFVGGGFLIFSGVRGAGKGLSAGLQYRLLKLFGLPDDIIRDQMRRRRRR
jgi:hypothetical protein